MDDLTLWELAACVDGYNLAHSPEDVPPPTMAVAQFDDLVSQHMDVVTTRH